MAGTNPYLNRLPVHEAEEFVGREQDVCWLLERILHPSVAQCCSVTGLRRVGKSSLLRFVEMETGASQRYPAYFQDHQPLLVYVDLTQALVQGSGEDREGIAHETLRSLLRALLRKAGAALPPAQREAWRGGAKGEWQDTFEALEDTLYFLDDAGYRTLFLLDGADAARGWHLRLAATLRALVMHHELAYVMASLAPLHEILEGGRASPLYNLFSVRPLGLLAPEDARALLVSPAQRQGVHWPDALVDDLLPLTGGHPDLLKRAAGLLWDLTEQGEPPTLEAVRDALRPDAAGLFRSIWDQLRESAAQREALARLALGQDVGADATVLQALQQAGLVSVTEGRAHLFGALFAEWVQGQPEAQGLADEPRLEGQTFFAGTLRAQLTPTEARLVHALLARRGQTVGRGELQRLVWEDELSEDSKALDTTVQRLRRKLGDDGDKPKWLVTVRGEGYALWL